METQLLTPNTGTAPTQFSAHVYCGQTAGFIRIPLGMEVGLSPGNIVLDGDPSPPPLKGNSPPQFSAHVCCSQTPGWTKMPLGMMAGLGSGDFVLDGGPRSPQKGHSPSPNFRPMSTVVKRLDGSRCHLVQRLASAQATLC